MVAQSQKVTCTIGLTHEYNFSIYPSPSQHAALAVLREFDNQVVLTWLTALRFLKFDENHWFHLDDLSSEQFEAISVLKDCPDDLVSAWLDSIRGGGLYPFWCPVVSNLADEDS